MRPGAASDLATPLMLGTNGGGKAHANRRPAPKFRCAQTTRHGAVSPRKPYAGYGRSLQLERFPATSSSRMTAAPPGTRPDARRRRLRGSVRGFLSDALGGLGQRAIERAAQLFLRAAGEQGAAISPLHFWSAEVAGTRRRSAPMVSATTLVSPAFAPTTFQPQVFLNNVAYTAGAGGECRGTGSPGRWSGSSRRESGGIWLVRVIDPGGGPLQPDGAARWKEAPPCR